AQGCGTPPVRSRRRHPVNRRQPIVNRARPESAIPRQKGDAMFRRIPRAARLAAVFVLAAAILAPAAGAGHGRYGATTSCHQYCSAARSSGRTPATTHALVRTEIAPTSAGFEWGDAAIGFVTGIGAMALLVALGIGSRHLRTAHTAS